jgi:glycosyltransferase involved in cell wall biosynthesis
MAGGLDRERFTPLVVLPDDEGPLATDLDRLGVEVVARPLAVVRRGQLSPLGLSALSGRLTADTAALRRLIRKRQVALVHSNTSVVLSGAGAARAAGVPHVWHVREIYSQWGRLFPTHRRLLASAAALPCVSVATSLQFGRSERVRVIHDGLAISPSRSQRSVARTRLGLPHDRPLIAVVGRISDWKGQDQLVRALATPGLSQRGAIGLLAGDAWPGAEQRREAIVSLAAELGVADRLVLAGFIERVSDVYGAADVIAVPSTAPDPLPGAALEAAAAGCAVVAAAHGGLPEIISDGRTGLLVPPGDPSALAEALVRLIDTPRLRSTLGSAASQDVRKRFAPERLLNSLQSLYTELIRA